MAAERVERGGISPFVQADLDEALCLAVGAPRVRAHVLVRQAEHG